MTNQRKCRCGFKFSGPGEFRNCDAFVTEQGESGIICPECGRCYVNGNEVKINEEKK
jgi:hypothetical protein